MLSLDITIRPLKTMEDFKEMQRVEEKIWKQPPMPTHQTFTVAQNGGIILGAYKNKQMIGFVYSFPGFDGSKSYIHSHMLGVLPEHRRGGLGEQLKRKQAKVAKKLGYHIMTWTFDPLESINAYLNIHKLGAIGASYGENYYGLLTDRLNKGLPTDRILIQWELNKKNRQVKAHSFSKDQLLLQQSSDGSAKKRTPLTDDGERWFVEIPQHFQQMKQNQPQLAKQWRLESRGLFQQLFSKGFQATDVVNDRKSKKIYYVFEKHLI